MQGLPATSRGHADGRRARQCHLTAASAMLSPETLKIWPEITALVNICEAAGGALRRRRTRRSKEGSEAAALLRPTHRGSHRCSAVASAALLSRELVLAWHAADSASRWPRTRQTPYCTAASMTRLGLRRGVERSPSSSEARRGCRDGPITQTSKPCDQTFHGIISDSLKAACGGLRARPPCRQVTAVCPSAASRSQPTSPIPLVRRPPRQDSAQACVLCCLLHSRCFDEGATAPIWAARVAPSQPLISAIQHGVASTVQTRCHLLGWSTSQPVCRAGDEGSLPPARQGEPRGSAGALSNQHSWRPGHHIMPGGQSPTLSSRLQPSLCESTSAPVLVRNANCRGTATGVC